MGLYEVLIHSQCLTCSRWRSARSVFGEAARVLVSRGMEAKQCTVVTARSKNVF